MEGRLRRYGLETIGDLSDLGLERLRGALGEVGQHAWTLPVVANGRLYLRYAENLYCYDAKTGKRTYAPRRSSSRIRRVPRSTSRRSR